MIKGKGVSDGIGFGNAILLKNNDVKIEKAKVKDVEYEIRILNDAFNNVINETEKLIANLSGTEKDVMQAYLSILQDATLKDEILDIIKKEKCNAEYATEKGFNNIIQTFKSLDDAYMAERATDIADMKDKVLSKILKKGSIDLSKLPPNTIIVAKEMTTSDISKSNLKNISGIITEVGGANSHVSIIARTHGIPVIIGVKHLMELIKEKDFIAINGQTGEIYINPSEAEYIKLKEQKSNSEKESIGLKQYENIETTTIDGHYVELMANIGSIQDADIAISNTADGIGLFRSEFLYMNSEDFPTEEEQFQAYKNVALKLQGKKVIIRTLDIGGDKELKYMNLPKEDNPFLGYRAIRICLDNIPLFKVQLRAILRASEYGNVSIMLPMISSIEELRDSKKIIEEVKQELSNENIKFNKNIHVGIMVEIPSVALMAEEFAKECDFFSIGTNDLIQYTIAVERGNEKIADLYNKIHPAVIKLVKMIIDGAHKNNIQCGMCGEIASDPKYIPIFVGLGLDEFSMNSNKILKSKRLITNLNFEECKNLADEVLNMNSSRKVEERVDEFLHTKGHLL